MNKIIGLVSTVLLSSSITCFGNTLHSMSKDEVTAALKNKTITTIPWSTLNEKLVNNAFSAYFGKQGQIDGKFISVPQGNDPQIDRGLWKVTPEGLLCTIWDHWNQSKMTCVLVYNLEDGLLFVDSQNQNFASLVLKANIKDGKHENKN